MDIWQQIINKERKTPTPAEMREVLGTPDGVLLSVARNSLAWKFGYVHDPTAPVCEEFLRLFVRKFYPPGQLLSITFRDNVGLAFNLEEPPTPAWVKPGVGVRGGRVIEVGSTPNRLSEIIGVSKDERGRDVILVKDSPPLPIGNFLLWYSLAEKD